MATKVVMPQLGESVVEGTVTRWLKSEGDSIAEFDPLVEVNTDKVDTEIPAPASGTVLKLYVEEGDTIAAGALLAVIGEPGDAIPEEAAQAEKAPPAPEREKAPSARLDLGRSRDLGFISPIVARIAAEHDLDLTQVQGSGRDGRITKKDILSYLEERETPAAPWEEPASGELFRPSEEVFGKPSKLEHTEEGEVLPLGAVRKMIAEHMLRSRRTSPHVTTLMEADLSRVVRHRQQNKDAFEGDGIKLTFSAYFARAAVMALKEVPLVNSSWTEEGILLHPKVNLGMAVSLGDRGLIVPVIKGAEDRSLRGLAQSIDELAARARQGELDPEDVRDGTFTITNHGISGSLLATPIINQPQCAILGVGAIEKRVVAIEAETATAEVTDAIAVRPMVYLTLTFDHRILDGAIADHYLAKVVQRLEGWS